MLAGEGVVSESVIMEFAVALFIDIGGFLEFNANLTEFLRKGVSARWQFKKLQTPTYGPL